MQTINIASILKQKAIEASKAADESRAAWRVFPKKLGQVSDKQIETAADMLAAEATERALWTVAAKAAIEDDACRLCAALRTVVGMAMKDGAPKDSGGYNILDTEILQKLSSEDECERAAIYIRNQWADVPASLKAA